MTPQTKVHTSLTDPSVTPPASPRDQIPNPLSFPTFTKLPSHSHLPGPHDPSSKDLILQPSHRIIFLKRTRQTLRCIHRHHNYPCTTRPVVSNHTRHATETEKATRSAHSSNRNALNCLAYLHFWLFSPQAQVKFYCTGNPPLPPSIRRTQRPATLPTSLQLKRSYAAASDF
jgi:hypothetical protein